MAEVVVGSSIYSLSRYYMISPFGLGLGKHRMLQLHLATARAKLPPSRAARRFSRTSSVGLVSLP